ncbi:MAG: hypothetical protein WBW04_21135 [Nitrolancea sp.]
MNEIKPDEGRDSDEQITVVTVPEEQAQAVRDFIASLDRDDAEVSGHMLSGGALSTLGGGLAAKGGRTLSNCSQTTGDKIFGRDWQCADTDS